MGALALLLGAAAAIGAAEPPPARPRPNVVLFFIDTLRADHVHALGYPRPTTPNLDAVAEKGTLFETAIAQSSWSLPSYSSIFTSLYPTAHNTNDTNQLLDPSLTRLAQIFAAFGYDTAAFVGGGHLSRIFGMADGFATFRDRPHYGSLFHTVPAALDWLKAPRKKPFFLMVHGYDPHLPYQVPLGFSELYDPGYHGVVHDLQILRAENSRRIANNVYHFAGRPTPGTTVPVEAVEAGDENDDDAVPLGTQPCEVALSAADRAHIVAHYDGAVTYADAWLGLFLAGLQELGLQNRTLLVVAGDHGEALGEKGYFRHRWDLDDCQIHVPLVFAGPGVASGRRIGQVVELVDVAPTLLELCHIPPKQQHQGLSLVGLLTDRGPAAADTDRIAYSWLWTAASARTSRWHLLDYSGGRSALYDLKEDPRELREVGALHPEVRDRLSSQILDWYERTHRTSGPGFAPVSDDEREMFRQSGYW